MKKTTFNKVFFISVLFFAFLSLHGNAGNHEEKRAQTLKGKNSLVEIKLKDE